MDILIKNGTVLDPANSVHERKDVYISRGRIVLPCPDFTPDLTIDAENLTLCPGFIDIHAHEDPVEDGKIYSDPLRSAAARLLRMGVTSCIGGNCGENYHDPVDFLNMADKDGCYVNIGLLAGHSFIRDSISSAGCYGSLTDEETEAVARAIKKAVADGCLGVSFGLEYYPGVTEKELLRCAEACKEAGGRLMAAHIRSCAEEVFEAEREVLRVARAAGLSLQISHVGSMAAYGQMEKFLEIMDSFRSEALPVYGDCYPYNAFSTYIGSAPYDDLEKIHCRYEDIIMCQGEYKGRRCTKEIFETERLNHPHYLTIGEVMDDKDILTAFRHESIMLCSDITLNHGEGHPRASGAFPRFLRRYTGEGKLSLDEAVYKMTALPAKRLGLKGKGSLSPGCDADIVIFDQETLCDKAGFQTPLQDPEGIEYVLVNGNIALHKGEIHKFGKSLRP